jgi:hypothetical protein
LALLMVFCSLVEMDERFGGKPPAIAADIDRLIEPLRIVNAYGLFAVMTTERDEIIIEGSADGLEWREYEFRYKPGDVTRGPCWNIPHQPRLDWQMWFAALGGPGRNPWFFNFEKCLLENSPPVLALLGPNPFPSQPPKYIRALLYEYHFTDRATRRGTDAWWRRELKGLYAPPLSLEDFRHAQGLAAESRANFVSKLGFAGGNR